MKNLSGTTGHLRSVKELLFIEDLLKNSWSCKWSSGHWRTIRSLQSTENLSKDFRQWKSFQGTSGHGSHIKGRTIKSLPSNRSSFKVLLITEDQWKIFWPWKNCQRTSGLGGTVKDLLATEDLTRDFWSTGLQRLVKGLSCYGCAVKGLHVVKELLTMEDCWRDEGLLAFEDLSKISRP